MLMSCGKQNSNRSSFSIIKKKKRQTVSVVHLIYVFKCLGPTHGTSPKQNLPAQSFSLSPLCHGAACQRCDATPGCSDDDQVQALSVTARHVSVAMRPQDAEMTTKCSLVSSSYAKACRCEPASSESVRAPPLVCRTDWHVGKRTF
uniref:uncharacterized protein LOC131135736 isoform X9 n=1 Tax=Doryrhamphus excisus TaxID=161450 RepID=UPI0025AE02C7|nr:uncharacterized protein LOC131135736 isoform X9 [Doryrhamphus excisus]